MGGRLPSRYRCGGRSPARFRSRWRECGGIEPFGTNLGNFTSAVLFNADVGELRRVPGRRYVMGTSDLTFSDTNGVRFISPELTQVAQWLSGGGNPAHSQTGYRSVYGSENAIASVGRYASGDVFVAKLPNDGVTFTADWLKLETDHAELLNGTLYACAINPDETKVAVVGNAASSSTRIAILDLATGNTVEQVYAGDTNTQHVAVEWLAGGTRLLVGAGFSSGSHNLDLYDAEDLAAGRIDTFDMSTEPPTYPTNTFGAQEIHADPLADTKCWFVPGSSGDPNYYKFDVTGDVITLVVEKNITADTPLSGALRTWSVALDRVGHLYCPVYQTSGAANSDVLRYDNNGNFLYSARALGVTGLPSASTEWVQAVAVGDEGHVFLGTRGGKVFVAEQR